MTTKRKPTPEVDHGGRVYYVEAGKVYEGRKADSILCGDCEFPGRHRDWPYCRKATLACSGNQNIRYGHRSLHPVQAVG